jgi:hypothetical protein
MLRLLRIFLRLDDDTRLNIASNLMVRVNAERLFIERDDPCRKPWSLRNEPPFLRSPPTSIV